jgi:hypothetical protein
VHASPLLAPDDDGVISPAILRRVVQSLTARDVELLEQLEERARIDVEGLRVPAVDLLWMQHFGLFGVEVDQADRVYLVRREEGKAALDERETAATRARAKSAPRGPAHARPRR